VERKLAFRINITPVDKPAEVAPAPIILLTKGEVTSALFLQVQQFKRPTLRLPPKKTTQIKPLGRDRLSL
jgi:hypothetical protein